MSQDGKKISLSPSQCACLVLLTAAIFSPIFTSLESRFKVDHEPRHTHTQQRVAHNTMTCPSFMLIHRTHTQG